MLTRVGAELLNYLPHRFENVLIDKVLIENESTGHFEISISTEDSQGRSFFLKEKEKGHFVLISPVLMEILALGSIVSRNVVVSNETVVFASISNFEKLSDFNANTLNKGTVSMVSNKGGFLRYKGTMENSELICKGDMLAFFTTGSLTQDAEPTEAPLSFTNTTEIPTPLFKSPWMHCADTLCAISPSSITTRYTYPNDHPLVKGHFPGNPLMMGVMQWMSVEDAMLHYCATQKLSGHKEFTCDATLIKDNGVVVSDIKGIRLSAWINHPHIVDQTEITATKKIAFRTTVKPGETVFTRIENIHVL